MRQINFLLIFAVCLAFALFSLENNQLAPITVVPGLQVQAPLSIELILAVGLGAVLAWTFGLWGQLQHQLESMRTRKEMKAKDKKIQELEQELADWKAEVETQQQFLPPSEAMLESAETTEAEIVKHESL